MKNLMIAAIALSAGFAGMTQDASAGHGDARKRAATRRIVGGILDLTLGGRSRGYRGHGHWDNGHWDNGHVRRYYVTYHVEGTKRLHFNSHSSAHRTMNYLRSLGAHVRFIDLGDHYDLSFRMHGRAVRRFYTDRSAHSFERRVERFGFHARVRH